MRRDVSWIVGKLLLWLTLGASWSAAAAGEDRISTEGRIKDQPVLFVLDTGVSLPLLLTPPAAAKLGISVDRPPPAGVGGAHILAGFSKPVPIGLPPAFEPEQAVFGILASDAQGLEWDFDAIIGWPGFASNMLLYEPGQRTLFDPRLDVDRSGWAAFPILDSNVLVFDAGSEGKPFPVMVDTGWSGGVQLSPAQWKAWRAANPGRRYTLTTHYSPSFGLVVMEQVLAESIQLGAAVLSNVLVSEAPMSEARGSLEP